jgi:predicted O-methyltransferase YrrM
MAVPKFRPQRLADRLLSRWSAIYGAQVSSVFPYGPPGTHEPDPELVRLLLDAARDAAARRPELLLDRCVTREQRAWAGEWPGEHYRLLPSLMRQVGGGTAVEVGTFTGMGTLALAEGAGHVVTYDILPWGSLGESVLRREDFGSGMVEQRLGDLSDPGWFESQKGTLSDAALIFVDGPKDRSFEPTFTGLLREAFNGSGKLVVFDDIRVANMVKFWGTLQANKLDATSLGHWSGTGLVRL